MEKVKSKLFLKYGGFYLTMQKVLPRSLYKSYSALKTQRRGHLPCAHMLCRTNYSSLCMLAAMVADPGNCLTVCAPKYSIAWEYYFYFLCHLKFTQLYLGPFEVEYVMRKEYPGNSKRFKNFTSTAPTLDPQDPYFAFHRSHRPHLRYFPNLMGADALFKKVREK